MNAGRGFSAAVFTAGACAMVSQILLFRELMALSLGSELAVGLIFAAWLIGIGSGSAASGAWVRFRKPGRGTAAAVLVLSGAAAPAGLVLARCLRAWAGYIQGEVVPFGALCWMAPAAAAPAAFLAGAGFVLLCAVADSEHASREIPAPDRIPAAGRVYGVEALGSVAGGLAFSLVLVFFVPALALSLWLAALLALALSMWLEGKSRLACAGFGAAAAILAVALAPSLDRWSRSVQWNRADVAAVEESPYGNIIAIRQSGQVSFFSNGRLAGTEPERVGAAFRAHVPLCLHPSPRRVLVAGGGASLVREALKHNPETVTVVELDPVLRALRERFMPVADWQIMADPRVAVEIRDARSLIVNSRDRYDMILMDMGEPETLLVNRYYTHEFFRAVRQRLAPGGVFAMSIAFQQNATSAWQADLLGTHLKTLAPVFPRPLLVIGQQGSLLITARDKPLAYDPAAAIGRYDERGIVSDHFDPALLLETLDTRHTEEALKQPRLIDATDAGGLLAYDLLEDKTGYVFERLMRRAGARVNADMRPVSTYYQMRVSSEFFRGPLRAFFRGMTRGKIFGWSLIDIGAAFAVFALLRVFRVVPAAAALAPACLAAGFSGLVLEIIILFFYQVENGVAYHFVGLVLSAFMGGGWAGTCIAERAERRFGAAPAHVAAPLGLLLALCAALAGTPALQSVAAGSGVFAFALCAALATGGLVGACFSLATAAAGRGSAAGRLYAADHLGAAAGGLIASVVLIPLAGVAGALWVCAAVLAAAAACLLLPFR